MIYWIFARSINWTKPINKEYNRINKQVSSNSNQQYSKNLIEFSVFLPNQENPKSENKWAKK